MTNHLLGHRQEPAEVTAQARSLQASSQRRIWSTLLDWRDWMSWVYVPIIIPLVVLLPYMVVKSYERSARLSHLIDSLSQGSRDLEVMTRLLDGAIPPWVGEVPEEIRGEKPGEIDFKGFEVLQDSRIIDMRNWNPVSGKEDETSLVYGYRRVKVRKRPEHTGNKPFRMTALSTHPKSQFRFPKQDLLPKLIQLPMESTLPGEKMARFDILVDFSRVAPGDFVDVIYEHMSPGQFLRRGIDSTSISFHPQAHTAEVTRWFMLPRCKEYRSFRILRWETAHPEKVEPVKVVNEYLADDSTLLAYKLLSVDAGHSFEVTWYYK